MTKTKEIILIDAKEYYILMGKCNGLFVPLLVDFINKHKIGMCIDSQNIGTLFYDKDSARVAKDLLLNQYSEIKVAQLKIIGHYWRE